jgi:amino acid permease
LLKALSTAPGGVGILPRALGHSNRHHTPFWGVCVFLLVSAVIVVAARASEQELVLFYAVAVFLAFLFGLLSMHRFARAEHQWQFELLTLTGLAAVIVTLAVNLGRLYPIASLAAATAIAVTLQRLWVRAGRPNGAADAEALAERGATGPDRV